MKRQSLFPRVYSVTDADATLRKPFKPPSSSGYSENKEQLARRLCARKRFVPWGSTSPILVNITNRFSSPNTIEHDEPEECVTLPPGVEPLVLWQGEESKERDSDFTSIIVDPLLVKFLRPHQRYIYKQLKSSICFSAFYNHVQICNLVKLEDKQSPKTKKRVMINSG